MCAALIGDLSIVGRSCYQMLHVTLFNINMENLIFVIIIFFINELGCKWIPQHLHGPSMLRMLAM